MPRVVMRCCSVFVLVRPWFLLGMNTRVLRLFWCSLFFWGGLNAAEGGASSLLFVVCGTAVRGVIPCVMATFLLCLAFVRCFFFFLVLDVAEGCAFSSFVVYGTAVHGAIACVMVAVFLCLCLGSLLVCSGCEHVQRVERCPCCGLVCFWCTCCSTVCHDNMATSCRCFCWFFVGYFWGMNICCSV